jgi:two-component system chemotaxis response regulator CheY
MVGKLKPKRRFDFPVHERKDCSCLVVDHEESIGNLLRSAMRTFGFVEVVGVNDHYAGLKKFFERRFTHVLFDARNSEMPAQEFLHKVLEIEEEIVAIPTSYDPTIDRVFELLQKGARGFLVKPFTQGSLEEAVVLGTKGDPIPDEILHAPNRNQALASLALTALDSLAVIMRQAREYETAQLEICRTKQQFERAVQMGRLFSAGGDEELMLAYVERALIISEQSASRLGRTRQRRHKKGSPHFLNESEVR